MPASLNFSSGSPQLEIGERGLSVLIGLGLAASAARPRPNPLLNVLALAAGSYLAYRGATGYCPIKAALIDEGGTDRPRLAGR